MTTAATILAQLGGNKFRAMVNPVHLVDTGNALMIGLRRGALDGINSVVVRLEANDTYTVLFNRRTSMGVNITLKASAINVYADQLRAVFTQHTGLHTSL